MTTVVKTFEFAGKTYEIRSERATQETLYAVFIDGKRVNGYTYTSHDLDITPTDKEMIALAKLDVIDGIWEKRLAALKSLREEPRNSI
jgi:hypothetical protein